MDSSNLKGQQKKILDYIHSTVESRGYPPTVREICSAVGLKSTSTVHGHLDRLEKKGCIRRDPSKPRAIELLNNQVPAVPVYVPVVGKIAAGTPILALENIEEYMPFPKSMVPEESFVLSIMGESMIEAGILPGDYVVVRPSPTAENGDIVAALIDQEATIKRFYREKDHIRLQPENRAMDPILVKEVEILGKVIGLFRSIL